MYYAGLDVASKRSFVYVRDKKGIKVESGEIETTRKGIKSFFDKYVDKKIIVAVEASGSTRWIYDLLTRMGIEVYVVNPNKVKAIADSKRKTDKIDAKILNELLRIDALPERVHMAEGQDRGLRDFIQANDLKLEHIHTSGHATVGILKQLVGALKPKCIIPIHTERPEKFKEYFGKSVMAVEDGQLIEI